MVILQKKFHRLADDIKGIEKSIYANVLAILAVFLAIFSLISMKYKVTKK